MVESNYDNKMKGGGSYLKQVIAKTEHLKYASHLAKCLRWVITFKFHHKPQKYILPLPTFANAKTGLRGFEMAII